MTPLKSLYRWWVKRRYEAAIHDLEKHMDITDATGVRTRQANNAAQRFLKWEKRYEATIPEQAAPHGSGDHQPPGRRP